MAVIQKIRERYAKFAGAIIALSLVAFIISEGVNGTFGNFFGRDQSVAKVDGQPIDTRDYAQMYQEYQSLTELFRKGQPMTETEQAQLRQTVLDQMVLEKMVSKEAAKLGVTVSAQEEKDAIYGPNPDPVVQQFPYFANQQTGQFDPSYVKMFEKEIVKQTTAEAERARMQWDALKRFVIRTRLIQKYSVLVSNSVYVPKFLADIDNKNQAMQAGIRYVKIPYTSINDNTVTVTDADLKDYEQRHQAQFQNDQPTRSMDYVVFDVRPNGEDTAKSYGELMRDHDAFAAATDNEKYVDANSEQRYTNTFVTKKSFTGPSADTILKMPVGAIYGPYFDNGNYKLTKVIERRDIPDTAKAQHILIASGQTRDDSTAHKTADSLMALIKAGANFDSLAMKFSDDGSKTKGGDLGYFAYGSMVPEFNEAVFLGAKGDLKEVKTQYGWHIIRVNDLKNPQPAVKLATVVKSLSVGAHADQTVFAKANAFAGRNATGAAFDAAVKKDLLDKHTADNIKPSDFTLPGLGACRDIIRWAYAAKDGEVSNPMHLENKYVVAKLAAIVDKGLKPIAGTTRAQLEALVKTEKKAKDLMAKYKGQSLEAIASAAGQQVMTADSLTAAQSFTQSLGYEAKVIGYAFDPQFAVNTISPAIQGNSGVYFITVTHRNTLPSQMNDMARQQQHLMMEQQTKNYVSQMMQEALRRNSTITYNPQNI